MLLTISQPGAMTSCFCSSLTVMTRLQEVTAPRQKKGLTRNFL